MFYLIVFGHQVPFFNFKILVKQPREPEVGPAKSTFVQDLRSSAFPLHIQILLKLVDDEDEGRDDRSFP